MSEFEPTAPSRSEGMPGVAIMVLGAVIAVLSPLFGLLAGSMAGSPDPNSTGPLVQYFVAGLLLGGIGVVILYLGFVRYRSERSSLRREVLVDCPGQGGIVDAVPSPGKHPADRSRHGLLQLCRPFQQCGGGVVARHQQRRRQHP